MAGIAAPHPQYAAREQSRVHPRGAVGESGRAGRGPRGLRLYSVAMVRRRAFTPAALVAVVLGGAIGVAARAALVLPFADADRTLIVPSITLAINVAGSFLLGLLVGWVDDGRPLLRAFVGTGILGGFTTYSAFAVQVVEMGGEAPVVALAIAAVSIFAGVLAAGLGLRVGHAAAHVPAETVEPPEAAE